jgi:hypothetical protein
MFFNGLLVQPHTLFDGLGATAGRAASLRERAAQRSAPANDPSNEL